MRSYTQSAMWAAVTQVSTITSMTMRNIIFARILSPNDFAIALTFGVVLSLFEYISNFGYENLMQRSKRGNEEIFQSTMQSVMVIRGIVIATVLLFFAPYIPTILNIENSTFNYQLLAIVPIIQGFAHLDPQRLHREHNFTVSAKIGLTADVLSMIVAFICAINLKSYWAFYFSFIFRHSVHTLLSHLLASRPYRLSLNKTYLLELWYFGLPLIVVGLLKYFGTEVDKVLIARYSGLEQFTVYFLTLMVVANLANIISIGLAKIFIRRISVSAQDKLNETAYGNGIISLYLVFPLLCVISVFGEQLINLVFGPQYELVPYLLPIVVILISLRLLGRWLNQIVIGASDNKLILQSDIIRIICLAISLYWLITQTNIIDVRYFAILFIASELIFLLTLSLLLSKVVKRINVTALQLLSVALLVNTLMFTLYTTLYDQPLSLRFITCFLALIAIVGGFNLFSKTCRRQTSKLLYDSGLIR